MGHPCTWSLRAGFRHHCLRSPHPPAPQCSVQGGSLGQGVSHPVLACPPALLPAPLHTSVPPAPHRICSLPPRHIPGSRALCIRLALGGRLCPRLTASPPLQQFPSSLLFKATGTRCNTLYSMQIQAINWLMGFQVCAGKEAAGKGAGKVNLNFPGSDLILERLDSWVPTCDELPTCSGSTDRCGADPVSAQAGEERPPRFPDGRGGQRGCLQNTCVRRGVTPCWELRSCLRAPTCDPGHRSPAEGG